MEVLKFRVSLAMLALNLPKRKKEGKGEVYLTLVKTIQCWHASLTVCIQDKSAF